MSRAGLDSLLQTFDFSGPALAVVTRLIIHLEGYGIVANQREALGYFLNAAKDYVGTDIQHLFDYFIGKYGLMELSIVEPEVADPKELSTKLGRLLADCFGKENTLKHILFLSEAVAASKAVCYVKVPGGSATGFMIARNIVITSSYVINADTNLGDCYLRFNYQIGRGGTLEDRQEYPLTTGRLLHTNPKLNYSVLELDGSPGTKWGYLALSKREVSSGYRVNIIEHPQGLPKRISMYGNVIGYADDSIIQYSAATMPGSAGAPVFNDYWRVVALNRGRRLLGSETGKTYFVNEATRTSAILRDLPSDLLNRIGN